MLLGTFTLVDFLKSVSLGTLAVLLVSAIVVLTTLPVFVTIMQVVVVGLLTVGGLWGLGQIIRDMLG